ncbi:hypothetical protein MIND_01410600 [Mycena indigotica]|uniref:F-box domain-containing protein n=1 Tax=Mycena indigotica TaxID=2126181 RepID=A0A8H6RZ75_9AGAR|nr:uncharacterized protein MIND_01410600 [Mycena indigotica]KAF7288942.1 hypothetical protein MIND_01410600 [Mycena indigotica]
MSDFLTSLPVELLLVIVDHFAERTLPLKSLSLVNRRLGAVSQRKLFSHLTLRRPPPESWSTVADFPTSQHLLSGVSSLTLRFLKDSLDEPDIGPVLEALLQHSQPRRIIMEGTNSDPRWDVVARFIQMPTLQVLHLVNIFGLPARELFRVLAGSNIQELALIWCVYKGLDGEAPRQIPQVPIGSMVHLRRLILDGDLQDSPRLWSSSHAAKLANVTELRVGVVGLLVDVQHNAVITSVAHSLVELELTSSIRRKPLVLPPLPCLRVLVLYTDLSTDADYLPLGLAETLHALPETLDTLTVIFNFVVGNPDYFRPSLRQLPIFSPTSVHHRDWASLMMHFHLSASVRQIKDIPLSVVLTVEDQEDIWREFCRGVGKAFNGFQLPHLTRNFGPDKLLIVSSNPYHDF